MLAIPAIPRTVTIHVTDSMTYVPVAEGEIRSRGGPQAAGECSHGGTYQSHLPAQAEAMPVPQRVPLGVLFRLPGAHPFNSFPLVS